MTDFTISLTGADTDRLFTIMDFQGESQRTGAEFATQLLRAELRRLFPPAPRYDGNGELMNGEAYTG